MPRGKRAKKIKDCGHQRLLSKEKSTWRERLLVEQFHLCPLCGLVIQREDAVLDHCHSTGHIRGVLHSGCNALLGKIENFKKRAGKKLTGDQLWGISASVSLYTEADYSHMPYHCDHRTAEEKRLSRNERARARAKAKKS